MPEIMTKYLPKNVDLNLEKIAELPWQVPAIIILVFLLILTLAQVRRHFVGWSFKGMGMGIVLGFMLAIVLEGFLLIGGKTVLIQTLGWKNPPKPLAVALEAGKSQLSKVLGISDVNGLQKTIDLIQNLNPTETKKIKSLICTP